jgi:ABC-type nickel/cobalt efflux system permease component RcnA
MINIIKNFRRTIINAVVLIVLLILFYPMVMRIPVEQVQKFNEEILQIIATPLLIYFGLVVVFHSCKPMFSSKKESQVERVTRYNKIAIAITLLLVSGLSPMILELLLKLK